MSVRKYSHLVRKDFSLIFLKQCRYKLSVLIFIWQKIKRISPMNQLPKLYKYDATVVKTIKKIPNLRSFHSLVLMPKLPNRNFDSPVNLLRIYSRFHIWEYIRQNTVYVETLSKYAIPEPEIYSFKNIKLEKFSRLRMFAKNYICPFIVLNWWISQ
jgi:hypothetical protein